MGCQATDPRSYGLMGPTFQAASFQELIIPIWKIKEHILPAHGFMVSDFNNSDYTGASFYGCTIIGSTFKNSMLVDANFRGCKIDGADFRNGTYTGADFAGATITHSIFTGEGISTGLVQLID